MGVTQILNCNLIFLQGSLSCVRSNIAVMGQSFSYRQVTRNLFSKLRYFSNLLQISV